MKLAIMQPYLFPYLGYFQLIHAVDRFILYDNLNYIKGGWISRNRLIMNNDAPMFFIIPVKEKSSHTKISELRVDNYTRWVRKFLTLIFQNYRKSKFFDQIYPLVERAVDMNAEYLTNLNCSSIRQVAAFLDISTEIVSDVSGYEPLEAELIKGDSDINTFYAREQDLLDIKTIRAISICKNEQAGTFINAIGGQKLYDKNTFERNGIQLFFINTLSYAYQQSSKSFYPDMSIIDILMNCGKEGTQRLLNNYELI